MLRKGRHESLFQAWCARGRHQEVGPQIASLLFARNHSALPSAIYWVYWLSVYLCFFLACIFQNMAVETCQSRQSEWPGWNLPYGHIHEIWWNSEKQCWFRSPSCRLCVTFRHCTSFPGIAPTYLAWQYILKQNTQKKRILPTGEL